MNRHPWLYREIQALLSSERSVCATLRRVNLYSIPTWRWIAALE